MKEYKVYTKDGKEYATFFSENDKMALIYFVENFDDTSFYFSRVEVEE